MNYVSEIVYLLFRLALTISVFLITYYVIPWVKEKVGNEQYDRLEREVQKFVLAVQQMYPDASGEQRLAMVTDKISEFLSTKDIHLSSEQIRDLIESAVKTMKMQENSNG